MGLRQSLEPENPMIRIGIMLVFQNVFIWNLMEFTFFHHVPFRDKHTCLYGVHK